MNDFKHTNELARKTAKERSESRAIAEANVAAAERALEEAQKAKAAANTAAAHFEASELERQKEHILEFHRRALEALATEPNMTRAEYEEAHAAIRAHAEAAAAEFRKQAEAIGKRLVKAYEAYHKAVEECNAAVAELDEAANVLQAEHGASWKKYAKSYDRSDEAGMFYDRKSQYEGAEPSRRATWNLLERLMGWSSNVTRRGR